MENAFPLFLWIDIFLKSSFFVKKILATAFPSWRERGEMVALFFLEGKKEILFVDNS